MSGGLELIYRTERAVVGASVDVAGANLADLPEDEAEEFVRVCVEELVEVFLTKLAAEREGRKRRRAVDEMKRTARKPRES